MSRIYLNEDWKFTPEFQENLCNKEYDDAALETIRIPHTVKELPFHYFDESEYQMVSGYRRILFVPKEWEGKRIRFTCEGAAHEAELIVNGKKVCTHSCGYTAFTEDITDYVVFGEDNVLVIKVDSRESLNVPPFGFVIDYMTFGGVYRDVYLEVKEPVFIEDVFVKGIVSEYKEASGNGRLSCEIKISGLDEEKNKSQFNIRAYLKQKDTEFCSLKDEKRQKKQPVFLCPIEDVEFKMDSDLKDVLLWNNENPALYTLELELSHGEQLLDTYEVHFGFRNVEFKEDGFYLNGKKLKIRGLNRHQSYPYVGYAMPESMQKLDADILKFKLGCNAARTSHYPQSHYFMDRCDEIGLLVFMEFPGWQHIGNEEWKEQACVNVREMITQYRNHVSIMIWGVRINESKDDDVFYTKTNKIAHELDDTRPTGGVRAHKKSSLLEDVYTYNDFVHNGVTPGCEPKKNVTSDMSKPYLVTEYNGHMYPTKAYDCEEHRLEHALRHVNVLNAIAGENDICGSFGWCMFDYNTHKDFGSGDRICYHGVMDMFRNPKMAAAIYACQQEKELILELSSAMDIGEHPECKLGQIFVFTNADSVRMYKNGHFIKEYDAKNSPYKNLKHGPILVDDFVGDMLEVYENIPKKLAEKMSYAMNYAAVYGISKIPPRLMAIAFECLVLNHMKIGYILDLYGKYIGNWGQTATEYRFEAIKDGKVVKTISKKPMRNVCFESILSHSVLEEKNTYDVAQLNIRALDDNGNLLSFFQEPFTVTTEGPLELIGPSVLSFEGGMSGVYVKTTGEKGKAKIKLHYGSFGEEIVELEVK